jgi:methylmalonyl-CoA/ethylmalonyl-CoA epimerase
MTFPLLPLLDPEQRGPFQVCHIVEDVEAAMRSHAALTGTTYDRYETTEVTHPVMRPHRVTLRYALSRTRPQIELIELPREPSIYALGLHHIAYLVDDMGEARERLARAGFEAVFDGEGLGQTGDGAFAYFDTRAELGSYLELVRPPTTRWPPLSTYAASDAG